jgi:hypothetical protein
MKSLCFVVKSLMVNNFKKSEKVYYFEINIFLQIKWPNEHQIDGCGLSKFNIGTYLD